MRLALSLTVILALAAPASAEPFHHAYGEWREYNRDWLAACPDAINEDATDFYGYSCFASTGSQELNGANLPAYKLTLIRNRLDGTLDLAITVALEQGGYDESKPMILGFSGEAPVRLALGTELETRHNVTNQYFIKDEPLLQKLLEMMQERNAVMLSVPVTGMDKPVDTRMSLRGVTASLDFMSAYARRVEQY